MKVRCINNDNVKILECGKIYSVKILTSCSISFLDSDVCKHTYSIKRFETLDGELLSDCILRLIRNGSRRRHLYKSKRVSYDYKVGNYLLAYQEKLKNVKVGDVYKIYSIDTDRFQRVIYNIINIKTQQKKLFNHYHTIRTNFYNLDDDEANSILREIKINKLKNRLNV